MSRYVAALRGATTLDEDTRQEVLAHTADLIAAMMERNELVPDDIISLLLTATGDVHSEFPAAAVRAAGISEVPMMCARELHIDSDSHVALCIRVMAHVYTDRPREDLRHVYLRDARQLRSDLPT